MNKQQGRSSRLEFGKRGREKVEQAERKLTSMERLKKLGNRWLQKIRRKPIGPRSSRQPHPVPVRR